MLETLKRKKTKFWLFIVIITVIALAVFNFPGSAEADEDESLYSRNLWDNLRFSFKLEDQYKRPEVQTQVQWLKGHQNYLNSLSEESQPYMYYILQEIKKRDMPGEIALLPMIESTYNPLAYSNTGAAGLWQLTSKTGTNLGVKRNFWFDGRRDIYNSTNAALNYLCYLHRFFKGNWILAIAAYHSGEGTVQHAVQYADNHQRSTNFWSLNLPDDTQSYVPKLLALAHMIQQNQKLSAKLPYIANTPYFTKIDVGTQIDLTNAAHLAGISYPEFLKLNPGNNRFTTSPAGPHTIVLPLDKVDVFVHNLEKIPVKQRHHLLAKHAVLFDSDLEAIPKADQIVLTSSSNKDTTKITSQSVDVSPVDAAIDNAIDNSIAPAKPIKSRTPTPPPASSHKVLHIVQKGESMWNLTRKYHVSAEDISSWNDLSTDTKLHPGQKLILWTKNSFNWANKTPNKTNKISKASKIIHYKIQKGDCLMGIARRFKVSVKKLISWNTKLQASHLVPGKYVLIYL